MKITRARATQVVVPPKPDSLNSATIEDHDAAFAAKFKTGAKWSDFALQPKWILELETDNGLTGIGETYRQPEQASVESAAQAVLGKDVFELPWRQLPCADPRVYDAVETAVLDLAGQKLGVPIHQLLGGGFRKEVDCNAWTGRRTPEDAARKAYEAVQQGYRVFKFKCSDTDPVKDWFLAIRERCGDKIKIILDPNQRWKDVPTTLKLLQGAPLDMFYCLEDPVDRQDYAGFRELREKTGVPMYMHISLPYLHQGQKAEDILTALAEKSVDGFNFNGSMFECLRLAEIARMAKLNCWHGSEVDLGILEASYLHFCAAASNCTVPSDIFGEMVREDDLITPGISLKNGYASVPQGPGLGVKLDTKALAKYQVGKTLEWRAA
jgi:muconate cycloisomerase